MKNSEVQYLIFTGLDGAMIGSNPSELKEVLPAIELLRSRNIPLIAITTRTADEILPTLHTLDYEDPFIVEDGGAIYIPNGSIKISFNYKKTVGQWKVIQLGADHQLILEKIASLRQDQGFNLVGYSELNGNKAPIAAELPPEEIQAAKKRQHSEPVIFQGDSEELERLKDALEKLQMRITPRGDHFILTGDHDEGSAIRFLTQLYREEYPDKSIVSIGLGDDRQDIPLLYAVDEPVLVRKPDGGFDESVGKRGLRFTRDAGPSGWNQAIIALVTEDQEA